MSMGMHVPDRIGFVIQQSNKAMYMIEEAKEELKKEAEMAKENNKEEKKEVDLYDPKFVHFEWDESLKDKKGFYCDHIDELRADVRNNGKMGLCDQPGNPSFPFHINNAGFHRFFYYDPNYEIKWAFYKEGKKLQYRQVGDEEWEDMVNVYEYYQAKELGPVYFDTNCRFKFRIKPEEEQKPNVEVNVNMKVSGLPNEKIEITINGKKCVFENAEQAKKVLFDGE